ncbi:MAG: hypothetical protein SPL03_00485 [Succinivibrio dextrinosolvens]|uniref:hypothetical protein n=1 Tax=Succinivibrio sp. TaxID=2053619 RepID=UPI0025CFAB12|nr:hypothetical protein [Succinivibrio sp.]MBQ9219590.1 hypothetical protein [Succinivibrio sp.]MDY6419003.1 hypothetical protein [Succinivibrio dextrinosolvens]
MDILGFIFSEIKKEAAYKAAHRNELKVIKPKVGEHELVLKPHFETNLNSRIQIALPYSRISVLDFEMGLGFTKNISYS